MGRTKTQSFITKLPLQVTPKQESLILTRLEFARQLYNACLGESLRRLALMRQSKSYQSARYIPNNEAHLEQRCKAFGDLRRTHKFTEYDLHAYAATIQIGWIGSSVAQKVASRAYQSVLRYAYGKSGKPRFKGGGQFDSLEGKQNSVISWNGKAVNWGGLVLPAIFPKEGRKGNDVIEHGLAARLKYVRLVRRKINGKNRFDVQLVCEGQPFQKERNQIREGVVGLDIGPSTIAVVAPVGHRAELEQFCHELKKDQRKIRTLQRKLGRQRRANNPQNYTANGTAKKGTKKWSKSNHYTATQTQLSEMNRKLSEYRKSLQGQLVNHIFRWGMKSGSKSYPIELFRKCTESRWGCVRRECLCRF